MPIASSSVINQIRNTPYTQTRVPYFPNDEWDYGRLNLYDNGDYSCTGLLQSPTPLDTYPGSNENILVDGSNSYFSIYSNSGATNNAFIRNYSDERFRPFLYPRCKIDFSINNILEMTFFCGFGNSIAIEGQTGSDRLAWCDAFGVIVEANGNFKISSNNGSENSYISSDIDTIDTDIHTIYLECDYPNSRWGYKFDNGVLTYVTNQNPRVTEGLRLGLGIFNTDGDSKLFKIHDFQVWQKRRP
jgi:hypothetical protein